jgi:D-arabinose 1-dehydrogenase-like Zn-dependent alcohol dehydrogenase
MSPSAMTGFGAMALGEPLRPLAYPMPRLGEHDVRVSVSHCGVCFTDIHAIDDFYGITTFPFVPGHEIVGYVEAVGSGNAKRPWPLKWRRC